MIAIRSVALLNELEKNTLNERAEFDHHNIKGLIL